MTYLRSARVRIIDAVQALGRVALRHGILLTIATITLGIALLGGGIPDTLGLSEPNSPVRDLLTTVGGSLAALFGIVVAVVLVAFQQVRPNLTRQAIQEILSDRFLVAVAELFLVAMTASVALLAIPVKSAFLVGMTYLVLLLFAAALLLVAPAIRHLLRLSSFVPRINKLLSSLTTTKLQSHDSRFFRWMPLDGLADEPTAIGLLTRLSENALRDNDRTLANNIAEGLARRTYELLPKSDDDQADALGPLMGLLRSNVYIATQSRHESLIVHHLALLEELHELLSKKSAGPRVLDVLDETFEALILEANSTGLNRAASYGIHAVGRAAVHQLKNNMPREADIWMFDADLTTRKKSEDDRVAYSKWEHISMAYGSMLSRVAENAIKKGDAHLADECQSTMVYMASAAVGSIESEKQRLFYVRNCYGTMYRIGESLLQAGLPEREAIHAASTYFDSYSTDSESLVATILNPLLEGFVVRKARLGKLDYMEINSFATLARGASHPKSTKPYVLRVVTAISTVLTNAAEEFSKRPDHERWSYVVDILAQVHSIGEFLAKEQPEAKQELASIRRQVQTIGSLIPADLELPERGWGNWPVPKLNRKSSAKKNRETAKASRKAP